MIVVSGTRSTEYLRGETPRNLPYRPGVISAQIISESDFEKGDVFMSSTVVAVPLAEPHPATEPEIRKGATFAAS